MTDAADPDMQLAACQLPAFVGSEYDAFPSF